MTNVLNRFRKIIPARKQGGFTLIELLVVIAIIAVLAAVVLVALGNARTRARDARRVSDLSSVSLSLEVYLDTTNSATYPAITGAAGPMTDTIWNGATDGTVAVDSLIGGLVAADVIQGDVSDPIHSNGTTYAYKATLNSATIPTSYILGADLETKSTASCASDYDNRDFQVAIVVDCDENAANDCTGAATGDTAGPPNSAGDFCICNGPQCS